MAAPVQRERRPEDRVVRVAEATLQDMARTAPAIGSRDAVEGALAQERARAMEARSAADTIRERFFGAVPERRAPAPQARPERPTEITTLLTRLREVREHRVGIQQIDDRNDRLVRQMEERVAQAERQMQQGNTAEAGQAFHGIQSTLAVMAEVAREQAELRRHGASDAMIVATDAASEHSLAGEQRRARLQLRVARVFNEGSQGFSTDAGRQDAAELERQATQIADRRTRMDDAELSRREGIVSGIETRATAMAATMRSEFADAIDESREAIMQTAEQVSQDMQDKLRDLNEDMVAMVAALRSDRAADITDDQMRIMARRVLAYREAAETLADDQIPQAVRTQMQPLFLGALSAMDAGRMQEGEALMMAAGEMGRHPGSRRGSADPAYRSDLATLSQTLVSATTDEARQAARTALMRRMGESVSAELGTLATGVGEQTRTIADRVITPMQQHPEQVTLDQLRVARAMVFSLTRFSGSLGTLRGFQEADRSSVISIFNRGLGAMAQGNFQVAETQMSLANAYMQRDTTAQQRTEIRSLSQMLEQNPRSVQTVQQYMDLNNRAVELRRGMRGLAGEERRIAETIVTQLEEARRRLSETGSVATEEQTAAQLTRMRQRLESGRDEDGEFRGQVAQLVTASRRENETEQDATARVLQVLARAEAERQEQERLGALSQLGTSFTGSLAGKGGQQRRDIVAIFRNALQALTSGNMRDADQLRRAGTAYAALQDQRDRRDLMSVIEAGTGATREPGARIFDERQLRVLAVYENWAERGQGISDRRLRGNAAAYRSLALMAARTGNRQEFEMVMDNFTAYSSLASVPESQLTADTGIRERRAAALTAIEGVLGNYTWLGGRRLEDVGAPRARGGWSPRAGQITSPVARALTAQPPSSITEALAEGQPIPADLTGDALTRARAEAGGRRIAEIRTAADGHQRLVLEVRFEQKAQEATGARTGAQERQAERGYAREAARLQRLAAQARDRGNEVLAQYYDQQATRVSREFVHDSVGSARTIFRSGQALLDEAVALGREADGARTATAQDARTRITALLPQLSEEERGVVSGILERQGSDVAVVRRIYENMLRLLAQRKLAEGNARMEDADRIVGGVGRYDRSVRRVDTRRRESGRRELMRGINVLIAVDSGRDSTLTGDPVPGGQPPSPSRAAMLRAHGRSQLVLGDRAVAQQERIAQVRNNGIAQARTNIRDRNVTVITGLIQRMLTTSPQGQTQMIEEGARAGFQRELTAITGDTSLSDEVRAQRLQALYLRVSAAAGVATTTTRAWPMGGGGEALYDASATYRDYRSVVGLYGAERFDAAGRRSADARAAIREGQMLVGNRVQARRLTLDLIDARGGQDSDYMMHHIDRQFMPLLGIDPFNMAGNITPELLNEAASHLPADARARYRARITAAGTDPVALWNVVNDLQGETVPVPGRPGVSTRVLDTVMRDGLMYYDADTFELRVMGARRMRQEGRAQDASTELNQIGMDMQIDAEVQRRDISRVRHRHEEWRISHESGGAARRVLLQPSGTMDEPERQRQREEREDTNRVLQDGIDGIETSITRSAGYHAGAAEAAESARDELRRTRTVMDTAEVASTLAGVIINAPDSEFLPFMRNGLSDRRAEYSRLLLRLEQARATDPNSQETAQAAAQLYGLIQRNHYDMALAVERVDGDPTAFPEQSGVIGRYRTTITADMASVRASDWSFQESRARQISEEALYIARDELTRANHGETRRYLSQNQRYYQMERLLGWAYRGGDHRLAPAHRDRATDAMTLATAITRQPNAMRAYDILVRNERIEGPGYYFRGEQREEGYGGGRLVLGSGNVASRDAQGNATEVHGWSFNLADNLSELIVGRRMEVASYLDEDAMRDSNPRFRALAEMEVDDTFLRLGVRRTWTGVDEESGRLQATLSRWAPANQEEADAFQRSSAQLRQLLSRMDQVITMQADPSLLFGSWIGAEEGRFVERIFERADRAHDAMRTATRAPDNESATGRTERLALSGRQLDESVPFRDYNDPDTRTRQALEDIGTWASYQRAAGIVTDIVVIAGTAVFAPEFLPAVFIGMGARGAAEGYEMRVQAGEWTGEAKFAFGMGVAGMVLVPLSEAAQVMRGAAVLRALGGETGLLAASRTTMLAEEGMQLGLRGSQLTRFMGAGAEARALMAETATALQEGRTVMYAGRELVAGGEAASQFFGTMTRTQRVMQYFTGAPGMTLFQRGVHIGGLGMMGVGSGHYLSQLPAQISAYMRSSEEAARGGTNIVTLPEILGGLHASVLQNVGQAMYAIRASGAVRPSEAYIPRYQQALLAVTLGVPMQPRSEHVMAQDHFRAQQEYRAMPETDRAAFTEFTSRNRLQLDPAAQGEILRDFNQARADWTRGHPGDSLTFERYMSDQTRSGARRLYEGAFESRYQLFRDGEIRLSDLTPAMRSYAEARARGMEPPQAVGQALAAPRPAAPPQAQPSAETRGAASRLRGRAAEARTDRQAATERLAARATMEAQFSSRGVAQAEGGTVTTYTIGRGERSITISQPHAEAAMDLAYHADRIARAGDAERPGLIAQVPENLRSQAELLATDSAFRATIFTQEGAPRASPNRQEQLRLSLEQATNIPALGSRPEVASARIAMTADRLIATPELPAADLRQFRDRYRQRAADLRSEGSERSVRMAAAWENAARMLEAEAARRAPAEQPIPEGTMTGDPGRRRTGGAEQPQEAPPVRPPPEQLAPVPRERADGVTRVDDNTFRHADMPGRTFTREQYGSARRAAALAGMAEMPVRASATDRELAIRITRDPRYAAADARMRARIALEVAGEPAPRASPTLELQLSQNIERIRNQVDAGQEHPSALRAAEETAVIARELHNIARSDTPLSEIRPEYREAVAGIRQIIQGEASARAQGRQLGEGTPTTDMTVMGNARDIQYREGEARFNETLRREPQAVADDARLIRRALNGQELERGERDRMMSLPDEVLTQLRPGMRDSEVLALARELHRPQTRSDEAEIAARAEAAPARTREFALDSVVRSGRTVVAGAEYGNGVRASNDRWFEASGEVARGIADRAQRRGLEVDAPQIAQHIRDGTPPERIPLGDAETFQTNALMGNGNSDERGLVIVTRAGANQREITRRVREWMASERAAGREPTQDAIRARINSEMTGPAGPRVETFILAIDKSGLGDIDRTTSWHLEGTGQRVSVTMGRDPASVISRELFGDMISRLSQLIETRTRERAARGEMLTEADIDAAVAQVKGEVQGGRRVPDAMIEPVADVRDRLRGQDIAERNRARVVEETRASLASELRREPRPEEITARLPEGLREGGTSGYRPVGAEAERAAATEVLRARLQREPRAEEVTELISHLRTPDPRTYRVQVGPDPARAGQPRTMSLEDYATSYLGRGNELLGAFAHGTVGGRVRPGHPESYDLGAMYEAAEQRSASYTHPISRSLGIETSIPGPFVEPVRAARERIATAEREEARTAAREHREPRRMSEQDRTRMIQEESARHNADPAQVRRYMEAVVTGVNEHGIRRMERSETLETGSQVAEVRFRLNAEGRRQVRENIEGHVRAAAGLGADVPMTERIAGVRAEFLIAEAEARQLIAALDNNTLTPELFFELVPRKGRLFASQEWGFSEGNTALGHYGMNALAQSVADAVATFRERMPGVTFADDGLSVHFPPNTPPGAVRQFYEQVQRNMTARGIRGVEVAGSALAVERPTTLGALRTRGTAEQLGIDPRGVEPLAYIVHGASPSRRDRIYNALFGENGQRMMTRIDALTGLDVSESRAARVSHLDRTTGQAREDFLLASAIEEIRVNRSLRRPRDVLAVFAERAQGLSEQAARARAARDEVGARRFERESRYWAGMGRALREYSVNHGQEYILRYHQGLPAEGGPTGGGPRGGPGGGPRLVPRDQTAVANEPPGMAAAILRGESVTVPAAQRDAVAYEVARQAGLHDDTLSLARFARSVVSGGESSPQARALASMPVGHPVRVAVESLVNSRRFRNNATSDGAFDAYMGTRARHGPGWAQAETARGAILRGMPEPQQRAMAAEMGAPPVMPLPQERPGLRLVRPGDEQAMPRGPVAMADTPRRGGGPTEEGGGRPPVPRLEPQGDARRGGRGGAGRGRGRAAAAQAEEPARLPQDIIGMQESELPSGFRFGREIAQEGRNFVEFTYDTGFGTGAERSRTVRIQAPEAPEGRALGQAELRTHFERELGREIARVREERRIALGAEEQTAGGLQRRLEQLNDDIQNRRLSLDDAVARYPEYADALRSIRGVDDAQRPAEIARYTERIGAERAVPDSTLETRALHHIARDLLRPQAERLGFYGRPNEVAIGRMLGGDPAYQAAVARGDIPEAVRIARDYEALLDSVEQTTATVSRGRHVDVVNNARQVIAIGDIHGDVYGMVDQLTRAGVLRDTRPDLPRYDSSVPLEQRYQVRELPEGTQIVFMGDLIDRGTTSPQVVDFVMRLQGQVRDQGSQVHVIRGNHEAIFLRFMDLFRNMSTADVQRAMTDPTATFDFSRSLGSATLTIPDPSRPGQSRTITYTEFLSEFGIAASSATLSDVGIAASNAGLGPTVTALIQRYGSWENAVREMSVPGGQLDFMRGTRGAVIIDGNLFTHGGPVMNARSVAQMDAHFQRLFGDVHNHWAWNYQLDGSPGEALRRYAGRDDHSVDYVTRQGWHQRLEQADGRQWMRDVGIEHIYVGHDATDTITAISPRVTNLDARLSEAYGAHGGVLVIDPLQRSAHVRVVTGRDAVPSPMRARGRPEVAARDTEVQDFSNGRMRTDVLRGNRISDAAQSFMEPQVALGMRRGELPPDMDYTRMGTDIIPVRGRTGQRQAEFNMRLPGGETAVIVINAPPDTMSAPQRRRYYQQELVREVQRIREERIVRLENNERLIERHGTTPPSPELGLRLPVGPEAEGVRGVARSLEQLALSSRDEASLRRDYPEYADSVLRLRALSGEARAIATLNESNRVLTDRALARSREASVVRLVEGGADLAAAGRAVDRAVGEARRISSLQEGSPTDMMLARLVNQAASHREAPREVVALEMLSSLASEGARIQRSTAAERQADPALALGYDVALARARSQGRSAPSSEDQIFGAMAMRASGTMADVMLAYVHDINTRAGQRAPEIVVQFVHTASFIFDRLPLANPPTLADAGLVNTAFDLASTLHRAGVRDVQSLFSNARGNGVFDIFPITDQSSYGRVTDAMLQLEGMAAIVPEHVSVSREQRGRTFQVEIPREQAVETLMSYALDDARRLPAESRLSYLRSVRTGFAWNEQVNERIGGMLVDAQGRATPASITDSRLPLSVYTFQDPTGMLVRALDSSLVRNELRPNRIFRTAVELVGSLTRAQQQGTEADLSWIALVRQKLEYLQSLETRGLSRKDRESAVKAFMREMLPQMQGLYDNYVRAELQPAQLTQITVDLRAQDTRDGFINTLGSAYREMLPPEMGITPEFAAGNTELVLDLGAFRRDLQRYTAAGSAPGARSEQFAGSDQWASLRQPHMRGAAFDEVIPVLDAAARARAQGPEAFRDFKFSREFHDELVARHPSQLPDGRAQGEALFQTWRQDYRSTETIEGRRLDFSETGTFEDSIYGGRVMGELTCQDTRYGMMHVTGVVGTVELPWVRQVIVRDPDSGAIVYRRRLFLVNGDDGRPVLLLQPEYGARGLPGRSEIRDLINRQIRERYEALGVEVRDMPNAALSVATPTAQYPQGINGGYSTYGSGRSPFFYIDSNAWWIGINSPDSGVTLGQNGLHSRRPGEPVRFGSDWSGRIDITRAMAAPQH